MSPRLQSILFVVATGGLLTVATLSNSFGTPNPAPWPEDPSTNVEVCVLPSDQILGTPISDGAGGAIVVWEDYRNGDSTIYAQRIDALGRTLWSTNGVALSSSGSPQLSPVGISDGKGGAIIVWTEDQIAGVQLMAQRINGGGECLWPSNGIQFTVTSISRWSPSACPDSKGGIIVTWDESRDDTSTDVIAQRLDSLGNVMWASDGVLICTAVNSQVEPQAVIDSKGGAIIQWTDFRIAAFQTYCQRIDENGQTLWQPDGISICPSSEYQYAPSIIASRDGGAIIAWHNFVQSNLNGSFDSDILAQRIDPLGNLVWNPAGLNICMAPGYQYLPTIAMDTDGGAFISWYDFRLSTYDIYAQHITANGQISWQVDGILVCDAAGDQRRPVLLEDGVNGAFVVWEDPRGGSIDLYWQRIGIDGSLRLQSNGAPLSTSFNDRSNAQLIGTSAAGAIVIWEDYRNGYDADIYGGRILVPNSQTTWGVWVGAQSRYDQALPLYIGVSPTSSNGLDPTDIQIQLTSGGQKPVVWSELYQETGTETLIQDLRQDNSILGWRAQRWSGVFSTGSEDAPTSIVLAADSIPSRLPAVVYGPDSGQVQKIKTEAVLVFPPHYSGGLFCDFQVLIGDTMKPSVQVTSPNGGEELISGLATTIRWNASDSSGILKQYIHYIPIPNEPGILIDSVDGTKKTYSWIPQELSYSAKISITAVDSVLNSSTDLSDSYFAVISGDSLGTTIDGKWYMISVPMQQPNMSVDAVFGDDYYPSSVPIFEYSPSLNDYIEPSILNLGTGYWLFSFTNSHIIDVVGGSIVTPVLRPVAEKWDLIGNPFPIPFPVSSIHVIHGTEEKTMLDAEKAHWIISTMYGFYNTEDYYDESVRLQPWHGYWIHSYIPGNTLKFDVTLAKSEINASNDLETDRGIEWSERLKATLSIGQRTVHDNLAVFGSASKATSGYDYAFDLPHPPCVPDTMFVELTFLADKGLNEQNGPLSLSRDIRELGTCRWPFVVRTSHSGSVTLNWDAAKLQSIERLHSCSLVDVASGAQINMITQSMYVYNQTSQKQVFEIQVEQSAETKSIPKEFRLQQCYPNPFNPSTNISFSLPSKGFVSLKVYDLMGREVAVLVHDELPAGIHERVFNAQNLSSGIYFYRLQANGYSETKKLSLIK
jgi:hypothetical protein